MSKDGDCGCEDHKVDSVDPLTDLDKSRFHSISRHIAAEIAKLNAQDNPDAGPINWDEIEAFAKEILKWLVTGPCSPGYCLKLCGPGGKCEMPDCFTTCCGKNGHPCC